MTVTSLDTRRTVRIGASDAAAVCGVSPWESRIMAWARFTGKVPPPEPNQAMQLDNALQPAVAELVARDYDLLPAPDDVSFVHSERAWMQARPDAFAAIDGARCPVELKTRGLHYADDTPLYPYFMQLHHQMAVLDAPAGLLAVLSGGYGGLQLDVRVLERDDDLIALMVAQEEAFLSFVVSDTPPPPDGSSSARDALRAIYDAKKGETKRATQAVWRDVLAIREDDAVIADRKAHRELAAQRVQVFMGEATELVSPYDTPAARWREYERASVDTKLLRQYAPQTAEAYTKTTSYRKFEANP